MAYLCSPDQYEVTATLTVKNMVNNLLASTIPEKIKGLWQQQTEYFN